MTDEWQPIDTAPKYGSNFVLLTGGEPSGWHWADEPIPFVVAAYFESGGWVLAKYDSDMATVWYENPTHWMRLPEKPQAINELTRYELRILNQIGGRQSSYFIPENASKSKALAKLYINKYITSPFATELTAKGQATLGMIQL